MDVSDSIMPLTLRLQALEAQVKGVSAAYDLQPTASTSSTQTITRRMQNTREVLERISQESDGLKRLLNGYEGYRHLLNLPEDEAKSDTVYDDLPDAAKVAILVESKGDIISAERDLREIELLKQRGVEGSGNLEQLVKLRPEVDTRLKEADKRKREVMKARQEVMALLKRYSEFTTTVSDMFLQLHHQLEALEDQVQRAERAKRKELKERY